MPTRLEIARQDILKTFDSQAKNVFMRNDIAEILSSNRKFWRLAQSTTLEKFIDFLQNKSLLERIDIDFPSRKETRYVWKSAGMAEILMTLRPNCHFSHYTAMQMHHLTEQHAHAIYLNYEQTPKPASKAEMTQVSIDRAFKGKQRMTKMAADFGRNRVYLLNGKHTHYLGVESREVEWGGNVSEVRVTDIERTLIDIVVRPDYSGGPDEILKAYSNVGSQASANRIAAYLQKLNYAYPYHQSIGFYMDRSDAFSEQSIENFKERFSYEFDFYLCYNLKKTNYDKKWKLFFPEWM